jgi:hypothetical protein
MSLINVYWWRFALSLKKWGISNKRWAQAENGVF